MNIFMTVYGLEADTTTTIIVEVSYFVGNEGDFSNTITPSITVGLLATMNAAITSACIADAAANGYTVGLLDLKIMSGLLVSL